MGEVKIKPRYYSVKDIKQLENCGRDKAYEIAKKLPYELRGKEIYVFAEDYEKYYREKREKAKTRTTLNQNQYSNVYTLRKLS